MQDVTDIINSETPISTIIFDGTFDFRIFVDKRKTQETISKKIEITNCIFQSVELYGGLMFEKPLIFENCIILGTFTVSSFFRENLVIKNCIFLDAVSFDSSGFFNFLVFDINFCREKLLFNDCNFYGQTHIENNILRKGTDIFDYDGQPDENTFHNIPFIKNNIGLQKRITEIL